MAHAGQPITCLEFCPSGRMLATADALGHSFHVFSVYPHPGGSPMGAVHHLYTLKRGETSAQVVMSIKKAAYLLVCKFVNK